jgi:hypothetical protein
MREPGGPAHGQSKPANGPAYTRRGRPASGQVSLEAAAKLLSGHARRSRAAAATQRWQVNPQGNMRGSSQPPPPESATLTGRHHDAENDSECGNVP